MVNSRQRGLERLARHLGAIVLPLGVATVACSSGSGSSGGSGGKNACVVGVHCPSAGACSCGSCEQTSSSSSNCTVPCMTNSDCMAYTTDQGGVAYCDMNVFFGGHCL